MEKVIRQKKRYENIDFMKGICILLVVATHLDLPGFSYPCYSLFRMPMYYFLSGIFFSRYDSFNTFIVKKTNNLLIPYFFFSLFSVVVILLFYLHGERTFEEAVIDSGPLQNGPIWFLVSLYEVGIMMYFISGIQSRLLRFVVVISLSVAGYYLCQMKIILPFYLNTALLGLFFYYIGLLLRKYQILDDDSYVPIKFMALLALFLFVALIIIPDRRLALISYNIPFPYHWFIVAGMAGTLALFYLSKMVQKVSLINYIGRYSIIVLGTHWFYVKSWKYILPYDTLSKWWCLYLVYFIAIALSLLSIVLLKKYLPWFTAQTPLIKLPK